MMHALDEKLIRRYFPELSDFQIDLFHKMVGYYQDWNEKINVVSRKDVDQLVERHIIHSLSIAKFISFKAGSNILDIGTGGGFPGLPLAILFPEVDFTLIDSIAKKIKVVEGAIQELKLENAQAINSRAEQITASFDFVVCRAVAPIRTLNYWVGKRIKKDQNHHVANGFLLLKGGDLETEKQESGMICDEYPLSNWFEEPFFESKKLIHATPLARK